MTLPDRTAVLAGALLIDLLLGEPPNRLHPVVWIGNSIAALERRAPTSGPLRQFVYGAAMTVTITGAAADLAAALEALPLPRRARIPAQAATLSLLFSVRGLLAAGAAVRRPLEAGDLDAACTALRALVSRDTSALGPGLIAAAAIESLAENVTDSVIAPWLAYALLGLPGAAAYRALNTLDSMTGYRTERHEWLGKFAARADDLANLIPARLAGRLLAFAAPLGQGSPRDAARIRRRDARRTASPNAGHTMAAMAGALGRTLEKQDHYRLGDGPEPTPADLRRAARIVTGVIALGALICLPLSGVIEHRRRAAQG